MGKRISFTGAHGSQVVIEENELKKLQQHWDSLTDIDRNIQKHFFAQTKGLATAELDKQLKKLNNRTNPSPPS